MGFDCARAPEYPRGRRAQDQRGCCICRRWPLEVLTNVFFFLAYFSFSVDLIDEEAVFDDDLTMLPVEAVAACATAFAEVSAEAEAEEERDLEFALRASGVENANEYKDSDYADCE